MQLKKYQEKTLEILQKYLFDLKRIGTPEYPFMRLAEGDVKYKEQFFGKIPFICIKIPTGGGKTFVASHAVRDIMNIALPDKMEHGIVMWFTPSDTIKTQTINKLKDRNDIHRKILDEAFENKVRIFSNEEALRIRKEDVESNICIIVSSLDAFRKDKKLQGKYKVYQENGELINHFEHINDNNLEKDESGTIINSLANVIRMNNPLIVIDEGHRSKTELSIEFLKDLNPSFIIEFTATPRDESNVLVQIKSAELKEEKMVKIPIILESVSQWQQAVTRGITKRKELEEITKKDKGEYIRPIALLQAEQEAENPNKITVGQLKDFLMKEHKIPEEEIAIKTSKTNQLEGIDLFSKKCPIRYIITVNALAEGWDCSFAYILISVANIGSKISVEQIIGRIVRLPNQKDKKQPDLNYSYVFASAKNFNEAANQIISGLEKNGYSKYDVINVTEREKRYEYDVSRVFKENISVPIFSYDDEPLEFSDLVSDFDLAKQKLEFKFEAHYDHDGRIIIDIKEGDKWFKERQTTLNFPRDYKNASKSELVKWLDKRLRFMMIEPTDKRKFIEKALEQQLNKKNLSDLSINRFVLRDRFDEVINELLEQHAKQQFEKQLGKKVNVKAFDTYPETITISDEVPEKFKKNYYEKVEKLNKEELNFIQRLDTEELPNIKFWIRNRERKDPFYLQGWKRNRFFPDFITITKKGDIIALEWKGEDRLSNEDTQYKVEIAKTWEKLGKGKLHFFLVNNQNIENVLNEIKNL